MSIPENMLYMEGFLKLTHWSNWKTLFFKIVDWKLKGYKNAKESKLVFCIDFELQSCEILFDEKKEVVIKVFGYNHLFRIKFIEEKEVI